MATYELNDKNSLLYVLVMNDSEKLLSAMGHDHVIRATAWTGTLDYDPDAPSQTRVSIDVPVSGLRADEDEMRRKVGYTGSISQGDRKKTQENMLKRDQLHAKKFTTITFRSTSCEGLDERRLQVRGDLTIRGKTKRVDLIMNTAPQGDTVAFKGRLLTRHEDFGFKPYSAPLGALKNKDELTFVIEVLP